MQVAGPLHLDSLVGTWGAGKELELALPCVMPACQAAVNPAVLLRLPLHSMLYYPISCVNFSKTESNKEKSSDVIIIITNKKFIFQICFEKK